MSNVNTTGSQGFEALLSCCLRSIIKVRVFVEHRDHSCIKNDKCWDKPYGCIFFGQKLHHVFFLNICQANTEIILAVKISNVGINLADAFFS